MPLFKLKPSEALAQLQEVYDLANKLDGVNITTPVTVPAAHAIASQTQSRPNPVTRQKDNFRSGRFKINRSGEFGFDSDSETDIANRRQGRFSLRTSTERTRDISRSPARR